MNYSVLPPEINSLRMFTGAGSAPMLAADKYALTYLGGVLLACAVIHARVGTPKLGDTP